MQYGRDPAVYPMNRIASPKYPIHTNPLLQYLDLHGSCNALWIMSAQGIIIEHSRMADLNENSPGTCHENVLINENSTGTFRYNEVTNWRTEGILSCDNGSGCNSNWDIYGNLWHDANSGGYARIVASENCPASGPCGVGGVYRFYNNTIVNVGNFACYDNENKGAGLSVGSAAYNNLYYGNGFADCGFPMGEDYAYSDKALSETHGQGNAPNPFVNLAAKTVAGYRITGHTNAGWSLNSPYNLDYDGNTRVNLDRGFVEYQTIRQ